MERNIIAGTCCGDCAVCTLIGDEDITQCALRIILKKIIAIENKLDGDCESESESMSFVED